MMHESWTGTFIQGMIMGLGMMVVMMVPGLARRARWAGRAGRLTRHCEEEAQPPTKQSGRLPVIASARRARSNLAARPRSQSVIPASRTERRGHRSRGPVSVTASAAAQRRRDAQRRLNPSHGAQPAALNSQLSGPKV
jgi:hypothetical protein